MKQEYKPTLEELITPLIGAKDYLNRATDLMFKKRNIFDSEKELEEYVYSESKKINKNLLKIAMFQSTGLTSVIFLSYNISKYI